MKLWLLPLGVLQPLRIPVPGYLIQTEDGTHVLVDSGMPRSYIEEPPPPLPPFGFEVDVRPEDFVVERLASVGIRPEDVDLLVCTHFDEDHAGNHEVFTAAELVVQRRHFEVATAGHPRFAVVRSHWDAPGLRYRLVEGDVTLLPGIDLVATGGHVPGHQSVLVRLPETGPVLLAIDAVPAAAYFDPRNREALPHDEDEAETRASTRKLVELAERERAALVVFGHDADQWPTLRHAPDCYT
jgi:N-acyl homoserine lactone hydrolase